MATQDGSSETRNPTPTEVMTPKEALECIARMFGDAQATDTPNYILALQIASETAAAVLAAHYRSAEQMLADFEAAEAAGED